MHFYDGLLLHIMVNELHVLSYKDEFGFFFFYILRFFQIVVQPLSTGQTISVQANIGMQALKYRLEILAELRLDQKT